MTHDTDTTTDETQTHQTGAETYHVVCHDCTAEGIETDEHTAHELADGHAADHGHDVDVEEVAR